MGFSRRLLLLTSVLGVSCAARSGPAASDWRALAASLAGELLLPDEEGFNSAKRLHDPRFDNATPAAIVRCGVPADTAEAMRFARRFGLPVTARGGGHSYVGASTSDGGLVIDTRSLSAVEYRDGQATIGGGALLGDVYVGLARHGVAIPSGSCTSVGIGGIALGGGYGIATRHAGLTCDAITALKLVTPDGTIRTVDANRDADLFWACRGGGGGQVGVVTSFTMRTFPVATIGSFSVTWPWRHALDAVRGWQRAPYSSLRLSAGGAVRASGFTFDAAPQSEVDILVREVDRDPLKVEVNQQPYRNFVRRPDTSRAIHLIGSDILTNPLPDNVIEAVLAVVHRARKGSVKFAPLPASDLAPDATAFPWRRAFGLLQWLVVDAGAEEGYAFVAQGHRAVAAWSVGRYANYLEPDGPLSLYYGHNYERLRRIKAAIDPDRLLRSPYAVA
jgi:FAD/FMN-containing dehydrogenase